MATHTPRSLLWLLANGSQGFGLIELLAPCPTARSTTKPKRSSSRRCARPGHAAGNRSSSTARATEAAAGKAAGKLIALAIAVDHASRRRDEIDPRWRAQVERLQLPTATGGDGWLTGFIAHERLERTEALRTVVDALHNLVMLRPLHPLAEADGASADPVLAKIRALLAKAESTTFEAEAMAFTAKAQELMTKHAIDTAAVHGAGYAAPADRA